ncbi:MAG: hypothetical protein KOO63_14010, partial [Bacteroidales bacterium]|nr:hypothetical protein [Candidatus Latescibacterota bacterium]
LAYGRDVDGPLLAARSLHFGRDDDFESRILNVELRTSIDHFSFKTARTCGLKWKSLNILLFVPA